MGEWYVNAKEMELYRLQKADNPLLGLFKEDLGLSLHRVEKMEHRLIFGDLADHYIRWKK